MNNYITKGVCAKRINFDIKDGIIKSVSFESGCDGNLKALSSLVEGMYIDDVIKKVKGITCKKRSTSCSDQLAIALETWKENHKN